MKKYISILLLMTPLFFTGCYDLDRSSNTEASSGTFWTTEEQCTQGVMGVYAALYLEGVYGNLYQNEVGSDIGAGHNGHKWLYEGTMTTSTNDVRERWRSLYTMIHRENTAIRGIQSAAEVDQDTKDLMLGEMYFLRALNYFDLSNYFAGVPIYDESVNIESDYNNLTQARSSLEETLAFCHEDLDKAIAMLPEQWDDANKGRAIKSAAIALKGKIYLYEKNYAKAIEYFEEVIDPKYGHELNSDFADLFKPYGGDESSEMIFSVQGICDATTTTGVNINNYGGNRCSWNGQNNSLPSVGFVDSFEWIDGRPFSWNELIGEDFENDITVKRKVFCSEVPGATFTKLYEDYTREELPEYYDEMMMAYSPEYRDPRLAASVVAPYQDFLGWYNNQAMIFHLIWGKGATGDYTVDHITASSSSREYNYMYQNKSGWDTYFCRKFIGEGDWNGQMVNRNYLAVNYPVIRLADVYLMLAEAYNEVNRQDDAVEYINKVRRRVSMAEINNGDAWMAANSRDEVFERIMHERAVELFLEGHREIDVRRWRVAEELMNGPEYSIFGEWLYDKYFDASKRYLWPIPQYDINMNPNLEQNPGW